MISNDNDQCGNRNLSLVTTQTLHLNQKYYFADSECDNWQMKERNCCSYANLREVVKFSLSVNTPVHFGANIWSR